MYYQSHSVTLTCLVMSSAIDAIQCYAVCHMHVFCYVIYDVKIPIHCLNLCDTLMFFVVCIGFYYVMISFCVLDFHTLFSLLCMLFS